MTTNLEIAPGHIVLVKNMPTPGINSPCLVLYPSSPKGLEVISYDGEGVVGRIGGGISAQDVIEVLNRLSEDQYTALIVAGQVGSEKTAREVYQRPAITYQIS